MAIDQNILFSLVEKLVLKQNKLQQWKQDVLWLAEIIIFHSHTDNYTIKGKRSLFNLIPAHKSLRGQPKGRGLPIGNYTSQFFANLYLNELDQFVKRELKCKYYVRYVDDFILLDIDKEKLKYLKGRINAFLKEKLRLELNLNKIRIQSLNKGIDFLGYFIKPDYTLARQKVVKRLKNKLFCVNKPHPPAPSPSQERGRQTPLLFRRDWGRYSKDRGQRENYLKKNLAIINSYYGHFKHAESFNLRKNICNSHLGEFKSSFSPKQNYLALNLKL